MNLQDYKQLGTIRAAAILTTGYVASVATDMQNDNNSQLQNQLIIYLQFTIGSLTSLNLKIEYSFDGSTWFQETAASISGGVETNTLLVHNFIASGNYVITRPVKFPYFRVSLQGVGTVTSSSAQLDVATGVA